RLRSDAERSQPDRRAGRIEARSDSRSIQGAREQNRERRHAARAGSQGAQAHGESQRQRIVGRLVSGSLARKESPGFARDYKEADKTKRWRMEIAPFATASNGWFCNRGWATTS